MNRKRFTMVSWLLGLDDGVDYPCPVMWMFKVLRNKKLKTKPAISFLHSTLDV